MKRELTEKLESLKGQLKYINEVLNEGSELEKWEDKEYRTVRKEVEEEIESIEYRLTII